MNTINAFKNINKIMKITPLQYNIDLSIKYNNNIFLHLCTFKTPN